MENVERQITDNAGPHHRALGSPYTSVFEQIVAKKLGNAAVLRVHDSKKIFGVAFRALGIKPGDEVIVPAFCSSIITAPLLQIGAILVFSDIHLSDYALDPSLIEEKITAHTKAIIVVHHFGLPALGMEEILKIAKKRSLPVIEAASQAFGAKIEIDGELKPIGTLGDIGCFRFLLVRPPIPLKNVGALVFRQKNALFEAAKEIRMKRRDSPQKKQAAAIFENFKFLDQRQEQQKKLAEYYTEQLADIQEIVLPENHRGTERIWSRYVIRTRKRDALIGHISQLIGATFNTHAKLYSPVFRGEHSSGLFPMSEKATAEMLFLPISGPHAVENADRVVDSIRGFFKSEQ